MNSLAFILFLGFVPCILCLPGGIEEIPVDDPEVIRLTEVVLNNINSGKTADGVSDLIEVVQASRQIVAGTLTRLTLRVAQNNKKKVCKVKIWEQPWLSKTEVTVDECVEEEVANASVSNKNDVKLKMFYNFMKAHGKNYKNDKELKKRFRIFRANMNKINLLRKSEQGTAQYDFTRFSDLSAKEFRQYLGLIKSNETQDDLPRAQIPDIQLPNEFDWRQYNVVTPVKDQKYCGSCWAFSVTGNVEGQWALKTGKLLSLSEQELVDCDTTDNGCQGGYMTNAYKAIMTLGGLETETDYPYMAENEKCHFSKNLAKVLISGAVNITSDEVKMAKWLVKNGPMSVALNANPMQFYFGGVSHPLKFLCNPQDLNHGVLIVGFGVHHSTILKRTLPYWLIKNSWGSSWGEKGYYKLYRGDGSCGIDQMVSSAIVD